jgi:hypothetical protein
MVRVQQKSTRQNHRFSRNHPAFPAQWFYGLYVISPVTRLCCHRRLRIDRRKLSANLGAPGPHDFAVRNNVIRLLTPLRPSRPAPNVRDDREAPLMWVRDARKDRRDLPDGARENCTTGNSRMACMRCRLRRIRRVGKAKACPPFRPRALMDGGHGALRLCPPYEIPLDCFIALLLVMTKDGRSECQRLLTAIERRMMLG